MEIKEIKNQIKEKFKNIISKNPRGSGDMSEEYTVKEDLKYTKSHEWIKVEGNLGTIGISDYAQKQLGDITYVEFEAFEDDEVSPKDVFATIEAVKSASPCYSPVSGTIAELNFELEDEPEVINSDPFGKGWIVKIEITDLGDLDGLLTSQEYEKFLEEGQ